MNRGFPSSNERAMGMEWRLNSQDDLDEPERAHRRRIGQGPRRPVCGVGRFEQPPAVTVSSAFEPGSLKLTRSAEWRCDMSMRRSMQCAR